MADDSRGHENPGLVRGGVGFFASFFAGSPTPPRYNRDTQADVGIRTLLVEHTGTWVDPPCPASTGKAGAAFPNDTNGKPWRSLTRRTTAGGARPRSVGGSRAILSVSNEPNRDRRSRAGAQARRARECPRKGPTCPTAKSSDATAKSSCPCVSHATGAARHGRRTSTQTTSSKSTPAAPTSWTTSSPHAPGATANADRPTESEKNKRASLAGTKP